MNKFLLILFISLLFFTVHITAVFSSTPNLPVPLPGVNCGKMGATNGSDICCYYNPVSINNPIDNLNIPVLDQVIGFVNLIYNRILKPRFYLFNQVSQVVVQPCVTGSPTTPGDLGNPACKCVDLQPSPLTSLLKLCDNINSSSEKTSCGDCLKGGGVWSSVGCIYATTQDFIQKTLFGWGIGLAGGLALLCIIYAAFMMQSSQGNPEKLKKAQELITSCIMGLMLIIFSVFILKLIGVDILKIPGFS